MNLFALPFLAPNRASLDTASRNAESLIDAAFASLFFTGAGLSLQRMDSDIAEAVVREMRDRGIIVLPVRDNFLAPARKPMT